MYRCTGFAAFCCTGLYAAITAEPERLFDGFNISGLSPGAQAVVVRFEPKTHAEHNLSVVSRPCITVWVCLRVRTEWWGMRVLVLRVSVLFSSAVSFSPQQTRSVFLSLLVSTVDNANACVRDVVALHAAKRRTNQTSAACPCLTLHLPLTHLSLRPLLSFPKLFLLRMRSDRLALPPFGSPPPSQPLCFPHVPSAPHRVRATVPAADKTVQIWETSSGKLTNTLSGHAQVRSARCGDIKSVQHKPAGISIACNLVRWGHRSCAFWMAFFSKRSSLPFRLRFQPGFLRIC